MGEHAPHEPPGGEDDIPPLDEIRSKIDSAAMESISSLETEPPTAESMYGPKRTAAAKSPRRATKKTSDGDPPVADVAVTVRVIGEAFGSLNEAFRDVTHAAALMADKISMSLPEGGYEWHTPLSAAERANVFGSGIETHAGSPDIYTFFPDGFEEGESPLGLAYWFGKPLEIAENGATRAAGGFASVAHNLLAARVEFQNAECVSGVPATSLLGASTGSFAEATADRAHFVRYLWSAYTGALFSIGNNEPQFSVDGQSSYQLNHARMFDERREEGTKDVKDNPGAPVTRPNGEAYYPRRVPAALQEGSQLGLYDVQIIKMARQHSMNVLVYGEPGTGKTAMLEAALPGLVTINGTNDTEVPDFIGSYVPQADGTFAWRDGPLLIAARNGLPLLVDEITLIDARVLPVIYPLMDGRGEIEITSNPEIGTVHVADGFYVVAACNPNAPGSVMSDALVSRFAVHMEVTTDFELMRRMGVPDNIVTVAQNLHAANHSGTVLCAPQARDLLAYRDVLRVFGKRAAIANFVSRATVEDRPEYARTLKSAFGEQNVSGLRV